MKQREGREARHDANFDVNCGRAEKASRLKLVEVRLCSKKGIQ
jgi:hypothetical protein